MNNNDTNSPQMEVKNFANFALFRGEQNIDYGDMATLMEKAMQYAMRTPGKSFEICFVAFDGDLDDENTKLIKGETILSYHQLFEGKMIITSGK